MHTLFLAMALDPEVKVVGLNRLPDFHSLPYINAVVKESSRWKLVLPLVIIIITILTSSGSVPHISTIGDEYLGFHIPKGTIMIGMDGSMTI